MGIHAKLSHPNEKLNLYQAKNVEKLTLSTSRENILIEMEKSNVNKENARCEEIFLCSDDGMRQAGAMPAMLLFAQSLPQRSKKGTETSVRGIGETVIYTGPSHLDPGWE